MEPQIQYAQTTDGLHIAYWTLGEGLPLVHMPQPISHIQLEWQFPEFRRWYERLAEIGQVIRYDVRGVGLSDRDISQFSLKELVLDLEAVVESVGLDRFVLLGFQHLGVPAIAYTARRPERVSHLVLWGAYSKAADFPTSQLEATRALIDKDWDMYSETAAHVAFGWAEGEQARRFAALIREAIGPEFLLVALDIIQRQEADVTDLLPQIAVPTLVLHRREVPWPDLDVARRLASGIPNARLALLEGSSVYPPVGDMESVAAVIEEFVTGRSVAPRSHAKEAEGLRTLLFTDIQGSTRWTQELGDERAQELLHRHDRLTRNSLSEHQGSEIKHTGDGFLASFTSAREALECAIELQWAFAAHNESHPEIPIVVRMGLNAGEPVAEEGDLFGTAVQLAARICESAAGSQILVANVVRELAAGKGFTFNDRGSVSLRGFAEPIQLYEVAWRD